MRMEASRAKFMCYLVCVGMLITRRGCLMPDNRECSCWAEAGGNFLMHLNWWLLTPVTDPGWNTGKAQLIMPPSIGSLSASGRSRWSVVSCAYETVGSRHWNVSKVQCIRPNWSPVPVLSYSWHSSEHS